MKHGVQQWALIASEMGGRNGKQCRERWHNQLDTALSRDGKRLCSPPSPAQYSCMHTHPPHTRLARTWLTHGRSLDARGGQDPPRGPNAPR